MLLVRSAFGGRLGLQGPVYRPVIVGTPHEWGIVALPPQLLTTGTIVFRRRRRSASAVGGGAGRID